MSEVWSWYELCPAEDRQFIAPQVIDLLLEGKAVREAFFAEDKKSLQDRIYIPRPLTYREKVRLGFDVHGTIDDLDSTNTTKNDPRKGPGYLPPSSWHFLQFIANAGFQPVLIVRSARSGRGDGLRRARRTVQEILANKLTHEPGYGRGIARTGRADENNFGLPLIEVREPRAEKAAACLSQNILFHFDNSPEVCEECERAGIVPFFLHRKFTDKGGRDRLSSFVPNYRHLVRKYQVGPFWSVEESIKHFLSWHHDSLLLAFLKVVQREKTEWFVENTHRNLRRPSAPAP